MTLKQTKLNSFFASLSFLIIAAVFLSSCESSRVGPSVPTPNPAPPVQQALVLNGFVKDASNQVAIPGATVKIMRTDGTILSTLSTDNSGKYSFDASNVSDATLNVKASKSGYGFSSAVATISKTTNSASVIAILLTKLQVTTFGVTATGGGSGSTTNTQSIGGQPLGLNVPAGAVSSNVQLTISSIPAGQVPQPSTSGAYVLSVGQFGPSGTTFTQPVTITFPLPYTMTPGATFALMQLNEDTGVYTNSGFTATVNADGTSASAQVTHFTTYTLQTTSGDVTVNVGSPSISQGADKFKAVSGTTPSTSDDLPITNTISITGSGVNQNWVKDAITGKISVTEGTTLQHLDFNGPALDPQYIVNGVQVGPGTHSTEKGNWEYRWYYYLQTTTETGTASGSGWNNNVTVTVQMYIVRESSPTGWYWISHDQGGAVFGPF